MNLVKFIFFLLNGQLEGRSDSIVENRQYLAAMLITIFGLVAIMFVGLANSTLDLILLPIGIFICLDVLVYYIMKWQQQNEPMLEIPSRMIKSGLIGSAVLIIAGLGSVLIDIL